ncbi:O-antigen ligase family protein [Clostridium perfringens]|uniref:O-antigen ligase family protein n=1 Tax=Clostridium perfringens TaxID=1502 RepID=UPI0023409E22|nr:O-antigen ligase family protein [Clostridium perfringens]ELC8386905.1 O-antigen ligase family protein [Clostridium perfringens]ELC8407915.1 O-antigen ligase family protein [Clostridium perfringens]MDC4244637.1 O-antigen ligase family protein [Clostridium perfringens]MDK0917024.1 O-antigen ligase family protein [Clostridium perfringens]
MKYKIYLSILLLVVLFSSIITFIALPLKILMILAIGGFFYINFVNYNLQVEILIFMLPLTDMLNSLSNEKYKSILGIYIIILFIYSLLKYNNKTIFKEKIIGIFIIYILICLLSIIYVPNKLGAIEEVTRYVVIGSTVGIVYGYVNNINKAAKIFKIFIFSGIMPIIVGILQIIFKSGMMYGEYDRVISTFGHSSKSGFFFSAFSLIMILIFISKNEKLFFKNKIIIRIMLILSLLLLYKTYTRSAWINFIIVFIIMLITWYRKLIIYLIYIGLPLTILLWKNLKTRFFEEVGSTGPLVINIGGLNITGSYASRVYFWIYGLKNMFIKNIFLGTGISSFYYTYSQIMHSELIGRPESVEMHNDFIKILCELGIIGASVYLISLVLVLKELIVGLKNTKNEISILIFRATILIYVMAIIAHFSDALLRLFSIELIVATLIGISIKLKKIER